MSNTSISAAEHVRQGLISDDHMAGEQLAEPGADMTDAQYQAGWNDAIDAVVNGAFRPQLLSNAKRPGVPVLGKNYAGVACVLVHEATGVPVLIGETVRSFRGEIARVDGGTPPHKFGSTGRVWANRAEFGPTVYGLQWREAKAGRPAEWVGLATGDAQAIRDGKPIGCAWRKKDGGWVGYRWVESGSQSFETEAEARAFVEVP